MAETRPNFHQQILANIEAKQAHNAVERAKRVADAKKAKAAKPKPPKKTGPPPIPKRKSKKAPSEKAAPALEPKKVEKVAEPEKEPFPKWSKSQNKSEILAIAKGIGLEIGGKPVSDKHTKKKIVKALRAAEKAAKE